MIRIVLRMTVAFLALSACAPRYEWSKEGAGAGEIEMARDDCKAESPGYGFMDGHYRSVCVVTSRGERYSELTSTTAVREADLFDNCIRSKGFELVPVKEE